MLQGRLIWPSFHKDPELELLLHDPDDFVLQFEVESPRLFLDDRESSRIYLEHIVVENHIP